MNRQNLPIVLTAINFLLLIGIVFYSIQKVQPKKTQAYVNIIELYQSFDMTKELDKRYDKFISSQSNMHDSLKIALLRIEEQLQNGKRPYQNDFILEYQNLQIQLTALDEAKLEMKAEFEKQIWARLNNYIEQFGQDNPYNIILGASGQGSLLYAEESLNITDKMSAFANNLYNGNS